MQTKAMGDRSAAVVADLVTLGETMVAFALTVPQVGPVLTTCIGAESNVAIGFARFGGHATWVTRLGDDLLGHLTRDRVASEGVEACVAWDDARPTGVAVKELRADGTRVRYYRSQSAARMLSPDDVPDLSGVRYLHLTGITPALSASAAATVDAAAAAARAAGATISFDVNLRPRLWSDPAEARRRLLACCRQADIVFVGTDEATTLVGSGDPARFAAEVGLHDQQELVVKDGGRDAVVLHGGETISSPAHRVPVVDLTGAGDAFAAGYLAAHREDRALSERLQWGHWSAARVVQVAEDIAPPPLDEDLQRVRSLDFTTPRLAESSP